MSQETITIRCKVNAPMSKLWECWNKPADIVQWTSGAGDWRPIAAENDLRAGGQFKTTMAFTRDGSNFDFSGTYTSIKEHELIEYDLDDGRHFKTVFREIPGGVEIIQTFDPEAGSPLEMQRYVGQSILDSFKRYVEDKQ